MLGYNDLENIPAYGDLTEIFSAGAIATGTYIASQGAIGKGSALATLGVAASLPKKRNSDSGSDLETDFEATTIDEKLGAYEGETIDDDEYVEQRMKELHEEFGIKYEPVNELED